MNQNESRPSGLDRQEKKHEVEVNNMENKLDGNAAAGTLQLIFPFDMTLAKVTCTTCGASNMIAETAAYISGMGTVVRCPGCHNALIRIAGVQGRNFLDMRGVRVLQINLE
jgi:Family of unknown function (DUF6510)